MHLLRARGASRKIAYKWLNTDFFLTDLYTVKPDELQHRFHLPPEKALILYQDLHSSILMKSIEKDMKKYPIISIVHSSYPLYLSNIPDPPLILYACGNVRLFTHEPKISVVGTRNHSRDAQKKVEYLLPTLIKRNWVIVSGMARGVDTLAHQTAMNYKGKTIAVLGFGFHHCYPKENEELMNKLASEHLLLSEYPPHTPPKPWHFPERNRIISALSFATLIIEAREKSGTFITAEQALEQGREVCVVPDSIFARHATGCNQLIKEGAHLIHHPNDLLFLWENSKRNWFF
ncbi:MAG: DNA-protecting protein DprA [Bacillaceae bacterium]|nr:DNA-protecting protein DprA [Bacillaceae bacterium]